MSPLLVFPPARERERERDFHFYREGQFESLVSGRKERRGRSGVGVDWRGLASLAGSSCPQIPASSCHKTCAVLGKYERVMSSLPGSLCGLHRGPGISGKLFHFEFKLQFYNLISSYRVQYQYAFVWKVNSDPLSNLLLGSYQPPRHPLLLGHFHTVTIS